MDIQQRMSKEAEYTRKYRMKHPKKAKASEKKSTETRRLKMLNDISYRTHRLESRRNNYNKRKDEITKKRKIERENNYLLRMKQNEQAKKTYHRYKNIYNENRRERTKSDMNYKEMKRKWYEKNWGKYGRKYNNNRRAMGAVELFENPFSEIENIEWHHVNKKYIVALPTDIHELYSAGTDTNKHRQMLKPIIKQLYPDYKCDE